MKAPKLLPAIFAFAAVACLGSSAPVQNPPATDVQSLIDQCRSAGQLASAADCARWAERKLAVEQSPCPDKPDATACRSFQELLRDNDAGLMNDFAHQDHVYVCFIPKKDEFFKVTYSDPSLSAFTTPSPAQIKQGVPDTALAATGESDFEYFRSGVRDSDSSFQNPGNWIYLPAAQADLETMRQNADIRQAHFKGKNIEIADDEWKLTETYPNDAGTLTRHTVTLQLATGRFRQEFVLAGSGAMQMENDGRCLTAPALSH